MIYPEHIEDIKTMELIFHNKYEIESAKQRGPTHNPLKGGAGGKTGLGGRFYGKKQTINRQ